MSILEDELADDLAHAIEGADVSKERIGRRVEDWLDRLHHLFEQIKAWAASRDWTIEDGRPVPMREEMMAKFGCPERQQPTLYLYAPNGRQVWIKPKALWVIGANGRIDIYGPDNVFVLIDVAEAFENPRWILHRVGGGQGQDFTPDLLADMI